MATRLREGRLLNPELELLDAAGRRAYLDARLRSTARIGLDELGQKPITRKDNLSKMQADDPPFASLLAGPVSRLRRMFASPGPTYVPQGSAIDYWRFGMAFAACGMRAGDVVMNTLSYHLTPGGFMLDSGLRSLGCVVIPAGTAETIGQVKAASVLKATGYAGTPSFLRTLLLRARELNLPLHFEVAFATAEMLPESLRAELEGFGIRVLQGYATADLGVLAYECSEKNGMHLQPECIVEILDLESGKPAEPGQPGQVVGTTFDADYPLLRFATGDVSALLPEAPCPCGRTAPKLKGILGRVGDAIKVKGMFVRGSQMEEVMRTFPAVLRFQAVVTRAEHQDHLDYVVELGPGASLDTEALAEALREVVKVRGGVRIGAVAAGAPRIDDRRVWK
jgi:phenylacetate-CoA ligase